MAMDFNDVLKLLAVLGNLPIADILKIFVKNEKQMTPILEEIPKPRDPITPAPVPPIPVPVPQPVTGQVYYSLDARPFWCWNASRGELYRNDEFKKIVTGGGAQMKGDRFCIDLTPKDELGREIGTGDPRHVIVPGDVAVRYLWWRDGRLNTDGDPRGAQQEEADHFELQSVRDADLGFTPVLELGEPEPGGHKVEFQAYILAEHNGGVEVRSNKISWNCD